IAGDELNQRIMNFFRMKYRIRIGELTAEKLKIQYATLLNESDHKTFTVRFLNQISGSMQTYKFPFSLFREAFREEIDSIITAILHVLETLPPELTSDIIDRGIILTGGGSLLKGLDTLILEKTELHVTIPDNPLLSVAMGIKTILEDFKYYRDILMRGQIRKSSIFA
ncbi:MAG: rod shape-determining protein, partial [Pseudomonadota bacterium]